MPRQIQPWGRKCTATNRSGNPCGHWAVRGGTVCAAHGGLAPQVRAAAERRLSLVRAEEHLGALRRLGQPVPAAQVDAGTALLSMVGEAMGNVGTLRQLVSALPSPIDASSPLTGPREHALAELYRIWCDRQADYSSRALRAGVEERSVQAGEDLVAMLGQFVRDLLTSPELGLSFERQQVGLKVAGRLMRALPSP